jgi:uncharacterized protein (TIGR00266 family)
MRDHVHGTTMPVLEIQLVPGESICAESGELSWMSASIQMATSTQGAGSNGVFGALKRGLSGGTVFMTNYTAVDQPGSVSFAAHLPGQILPIDVAPQPGYGFMAHRRAYVCGQPNVTLTTGFQQRLGAGIFGGEGFVLQRIGGQGRAWVQLSGEVVTWDLQPGQTIRVHPGHVGMFQECVQFTVTTVPGIKNKLFGGDGVFLAQLTGPGRVWLQSLPIDRLAHSLMPYLPHTEGGQQRSGGGLASGIANTFLKND